MMPYFILAGGIVALDQLVKYLVRTQLPLYHTIEMLPGLLNLTYVQNTGAAFSLFADSTMILALFSLLISIGIAAYMALRPLPHRFGRLTLALVLGGAVGNLIDRFFLGYVVDMFAFAFIDFPVFNVADVSLVCGGILLCTYVMFFSEEKSTETPHEVNE